MTMIDGTEKPLRDYDGQVLLLVNTASKCGFTPQYSSLEKLYRKYRDEGFTILAFPANNFGAQEPGTDAQIKEFCSTNYDVTFDLFSKISVKGDDIHPLYAYLTSLPEVGGEIQWNFTKFLVDRDGTVISRFNTRVDPLDESVTTALEKALGRE
jgi:glutathione peroxidase